MKKSLLTNIVRQSLLNPLLFNNSYSSWHNKPASWPDIRKNCQKGHIYLLADTRYPIGFIVSATGGYSVKIDGISYDDYASNAQFSMADWSGYTATEGYEIDYPAGAIKAHIVDIFPQTASENIAAFKCARVAASGTEEQGVLWAHFNLTNAIKIVGVMSSESGYHNRLVEAITAKNNLIIYNVASSLNQSGIYTAFTSCEALQYLPVLKAENQTYASGYYQTLRDVPVKKIIIKNNNGGELFNILKSAKIEELNIENGLTLGSGTGTWTNASSSTNLKKFPKINSNKAENFIMYEVPSLEPVNIDDRFNDIRKLFRFYGTASVPTPALKSLRVSNNAPFDGATPQIQVDYTDLDKQALAQLFNDLPSVSAGQIISIVGARGTADLTAEDEAIATDKGWTIAK